MTKNFKNIIALKAFFVITKKWALTSSEECILLGIPKSTFYRWKKKLAGSLNCNTIERISYILGIYKALKILLPSEQAALTWIHKPNAAPLFGGRPAIKISLTTTFSTTSHRAGIGGSFM